MAAIHTHASNRIRNHNRKKATLSGIFEDRKAVFKSVLDNPLVVNWPEIPLNVQNTVLAALTKLLQDSGVGAYHEERAQRSRKKKAKRTATFRENQRSKDVEATNSIAVGSKRKADAQEDTTDVSIPSKKRKLEGEVVVSSPALKPSPSVEISTTLPELKPPSMLSHIIFGINEVTKAIESQTLEYRAQSFSSLSNHVDHHLKSPLRFVFACTKDVNPPALIEHFPPLIGAANATRPRHSAHKDIVLVPLPKMAEGVLTEAVMLRRVAVLALDADTPGIESLEAFVSPLPVLVAPWLVAPASRPSYPPKRGANGARLQPSDVITPSEVHLIPTHIKHIRTSAPKDMKAAKELRADGRAKAKSKMVGRRNNNMSTQHGTKNSS